MVLSEAQEGPGSAMSHRPEGFIDTVLRVTESSSSAKLWLLVYVALWLLGVTSLLSRNEKQGIGFIIAGGIVGAAWVYTYVIGG